MLEIFANRILLILGTVHKFSCPYRSQQNAMVERKHQQLLNVASSLVFQAAIPITYWGECVSIAAYLIHRTPSPNLEDKYPFEVLFSKAPDYSLINVFGCLIDFTPYY